MRPTLPLMALALVAAALPAGDARADTIMLRASVRVPAGVESVTLGDIAELNGPDAAALEDLEIASLAGASDVLELSVADVRRVLDEARVHWGRLHLTGRQVVVRTGRGSLAEAPRAMTPLSVAPPASSRRDRADEEPIELNAAEVTGQSTLRGQVAATIAHGLKIDPADLRLQFDARDAALLDTPLGGEAIFEIDPLSSFHGDRVELAIRRWEGGRVTEHARARVHPSVRTNIVALRRDIARGETISLADLERGEQWLAPGAAAETCKPVQAVGRVAARPLRAGEVLTTRHVRPETVVERGDPLMVRCLVGGVAISMTAEARDAGAVGDTINCRKAGERSEFRATITGPGEAIVDLARRGS